ncbi:hypothetical protein RN001_001935 [Aquatica leii]|uniref:Neurotransmitter-gated ion-channel ligand-binding domain-containing protein n=1 Tax=Aquatica leii TaxID=1421715 RepID=A0AAN7Q4Q3_9COLE|nr:hypothetical protein RN001_001935 [Aquatica leii]
MNPVIFLHIFYITAVFCLNCDTKIDTDIIYENKISIVNVSTTIEEVYLIDTLNMDVEVTLLLHQRWLDSSLGNNAKTQEKAVGGQIWRPKITTVKGCLKACSNGDDTQYWRGFEGNILLSEKMIVKTRCTKNFQKYPFDIQVCELKFGTYLFPVEEIKLEWENQSVDIQASINLNGFQLINVTTFIEKDLRLSGNFDVLVLHFVVKRQFCNNIILIISVWILLILFSYGSFWIDHTRITFRLSICLLSALFLMYFYVIFSILNVSVLTLTVLDWFFILHLIFIVFAFIENILISRILSYGYDMVIDKDKLIHYNKVVMYIEYSNRLFYLIVYLLCLLLFTFKLLY